jgi:hypothetical protein
MGARGRLGLVAEKELQVAAFDENGGVLDQARGLAARRRILPFDGRKRRLLRVQDFIGDVAPASAVARNVEGVQKLNQPCFLQRREAQARWKQVHVLSAESANEAHGDVEAQLDHVVERQKDRRAVFRFGMSERNVNFSQRVAYHDLATLGIGAIVEHRADCRRRKWRCREAGWGRRQQQSAWKDFGPPENRVVAGWDVGIIGENATPIVGRDQRTPRRD